MGKFKLDIQVVALVLIIIVLLFIYFKRIENLEEVDIEIYDLNNFNKDHDMTNNGFFNYLPEKVMTVFKKIYID